MGEHLVVKVDQLLKPDWLVPQATCGLKPEMVGPSSSSVVKNDEAVVVVDDEEADEEAPLIGIGECRICQEEDSINSLESPCACSGSLKYAHRKCVQYWCNEKGDITCEICHQDEKLPRPKFAADTLKSGRVTFLLREAGVVLQPYQPGYTAPPRPPPSETTIDIGGVWQISGTPLDVHDPRLRAIAEAERQFFEADYDDYHGANSSGAAFCRSAALILMALLLLRHAVSINDDGDTEGDDEATAFFSLFLLRTVGFLLPCYIMIWAISILQRRRQRQEAAAIAAAQFAIVVQSAQTRGLLVAAPAPAPPQPQVTPSHATPHQERALR